MNEKVLRVLEYNKIIEQLEQFASSKPGKNKCISLTPSIDLAEIENAQIETKDALNRLFKKGRIHFNGNNEIKGLLKSLDIGSILSIPELLKIADSLECASRTKNYGRPDRDDEKGDSLTGLFDNLEPLTPVLSEIRRCIISEEEISDDASATLKLIRRSMSLTNDRIHSQLNSMVAGSMRTLLQDPVITMRNNRYCIPVKSENKNQVPGLVHDQSSTGSTLFIEPAAIVALNNEIRELELKEHAEIEVILASLSSMTGEHTEKIAENEKILTSLDFIFAKGLMAMEQNATMPVFNEDHYIHIRQARHPLLDKKKVVPIDVHLGRDFDLLVITGPNTGGKTVTLKTMGLFCLMGQAGLHIPALDRSTLSIFQEVYADIGDEQSIEQSLSTFSSHMTNIVHILQHADENSLCLFDELGAGTDPTEGAALAIAILTHLHDRGIRTMATTHYSELKIFALSTEFVENACCEFDVATLRPTYRLLIGIPGKSNAFAISSKLGLPDSIIESAKEHISEESESFEDVISNLETSRKTIEKEHLEIQTYKEEIKKLKDELSKKQIKLEQSREKILRDANEQAREILQEAKELADKTIRDFQKYGSNIPMKELEATRENVRSRIAEKNEKLALKSSPQQGKKPFDPAKLKLGDTVKILSMGLKGTVNSLPDKKGNLFVQCGIIRSQIHVNDIILIDEAEIQSTGFSRMGSGANKLSKAGTMSMEINLLGKTVDEALSLLDKYLDDAYLSRLSNVRIVHGKGTGALRSAIHNHLKKAKYVKSYRLGEFGEGDAGVTIVEFK